MKYLLYITGSISCYKSIDLCRALINDGHQVIVLLSQAAEKFIKKDIFLYLGANAAYIHDDDFSSPSKEIRHIELSRWCDFFVVCPASANTISHLASGTTKDLGSTIFLALDEKVQKLIFPAMNTKMLENSIIKNKIKELESVINITVFPTEYGELACGEVGAGKLLDIEKIKTILTSWPLVKYPKKVLISTGASISPLDDVRYLTNPASGKTGLKLAQKFLQQGYDVSLITGIYSNEFFQTLKDHPSFSLHCAATANDYLRLTEEMINDCDVFISAAAICDISFNYSAGKMKKETLSRTLEIHQSPDVLKKMINKKKENQYFIGFAAESELTEEMLRKKWESKKVDLLIGTEVNSGAKIGSTTMGFKTSTANYKIYENKKISYEGILSKKDLSQMIFEKANQWLN